MITRRQKVLMHLIGELSKRDISSRFMIEKNLFLLNKEGNLDEGMNYNFFPYNYGPFSNMSFRDLNFLRSKGYLTENEKAPGLTGKGRKAADSIDFLTKEKIKDFSSRFGSNKKIRDYVYANYPEYTIKSKGGFQAKMEAGAFSIGYEGRDIDSFLEILIANGIESVLDLRNNPFSMNFSFRGSRLKETLKKSGIGYSHFPSLGIEGSLRKGLSSKEDYQRLFRDYRKRVLAECRQDILGIQSRSGKERVALLCFERDKDNCHRGVVSGILESKGVNVRHL